MGARPQPNSQDTPTKHYGLKKRLASDGGPPREAPGKQSHVLGVPSTAGQRSLGLYHRDGKCVGREDEDPASGPGRPRPVSPEQQLLEGRVMIQIAPQMRILVPWKPSIFGTGSMAWPAFVSKRCRP